MRIVQLKVSIWDRWGLMTERARARDGSAGWQEQERVPELVLAAESDPSSGAMLPPSNTASLRLWPAHHR